MSDASGEDAGAPGHPAPDEAGVSEGASASASAGGPPGATAGQQYAELIKEQLAAEDTRKSSIEARSATVITGTSVIVTAMFGVVALVAKDEQFILSGAAKLALALSLISFGVAALSAIKVALPAEYWVPDPSELKGYAVTESTGATWTGAGDPGPTVLNDDYWLDASAIGERRVAEMRANMVISAQVRNGEKARWLIYGMASQAVTVVLLAVAATSIMVWQPPGETNSDACCKVTTCEQEGEPGRPSGCTCERGCCADRCPPRPPHPVPETHPDPPTSKPTALGPVPSEPAPSEPLPLEPVPSEPAPEPPPDRDPEVASTTTGQLPRGG